MRHKKTRPGPEPADRAGKAPGSCVLAFAGMLTALFVWGGSRRVRVLTGGGFEGEGRDFGTVLLEFPLVVAVGALAPVCLWLVALRLLRPVPGAVRLPVAAVAVLAVLALAAWRLHDWANPPQGPPL